MIYYIQKKVISRELKIHLYLREHSPMRRRDTGSPRSQHLEKLLISTIYLHLFPFPLSFCLSLSWSTFLSLLLPVPFSHMHMNNSTILSRMQDDSQMMQLLLFCHMSFSSCVHSFSFLSVLSRQNYHPCSCRVMNNNLVIDHFTVLPSVLLLCKWMQLSGYVELSLCVCMCAFLLETMSLIDTVPSFLYY